MSEDWIHRTAIELGRTFLVVTILGAVPAGYFAAQPLEMPVLDQSGTIAPASGLPLPPLSDSLMTAIVNAGLFRRQRAPAAVRYSVTPAEVPPESSGPPKPVPVLTGIVWGSRPAAILEGLPGWDTGRLVTTGELVEGIRVHRIERDRVILFGYDTTWTLRVRTPW